MTGMKKLVDLATAIFPKKLVDFNGCLLKSKFPRTDDHPIYKPKEGHLEGVPQPYP